MPFVHPWIILTGAGAVAVPVLIHILNRTRFRIRDWAAMKFLMEAVRKNRRRLRIEELILLAIRCLIVLLLALALARFTGCGAMDVLPSAGAGSQMGVYLLDDSYSMGQKVGAGQVFSAAVTDLVEQVRNMPKSGRVAIMLTSQSEETERFFGPEYAAKVDVESLVAKIQALEPSDRRTPLAEAMRAAGDAFDDDPGAKRLYVLSDFRRVDLDPREQADALRKAFEALRARGVEVVAMDYGLEAQANLTVESIELLNRFSVARVPAPVRLTVLNDGRRRAENVEITLKVTCRVGAEMKELVLPMVVIPRIDAGDRGSVEFKVNVPQAGSAVVTAQLPADALEGDNSVSLALEVRPHIAVLVVDGHSDIADPTESESFDFRLAIDPKGTGYTGFDVDVISPESISAARFEDYDFVALLDVPDFPRDGAENVPYLSLKSLEDYVKSGGGLVVFVGDGVNPAFYNGPMHKGGRGLSPFRVKPRVGEADEQAKPFRLDARSLASDSILGVFTGEGAVLTGYVRFYAFLPAEEIAAVVSEEDVKPPRVLGRFDDANSSPACVERRFGDGTVVMFYTSASKRWNDWPSDEVGTYVVVVQEMIRTLARADSGRFTGPVGEPVVYELPHHFTEARATLKTPRFPKDDIVSLIAAEERGRRSLRYARAVNRGVYTLDVTAPGKPDRTVFFARNPDPTEGKLAPGGRKALTVALGSEDFRYVQRTGATGGATVEATSDKEYWMYALAGMLILLAAETYLAQRFGHYS